MAGFRLQAHRRSWLLGILSLFLAGNALASTWNSEEYDLYPGDFNGDGATDVLFVARNAGAQSGIALSNGIEWVAGAQYWNSDWLQLQWHSRATIPVIGDFNWDGRDDIFMHCQNSCDHTMLLAQVDGTFLGRSQDIPNSRAGLVWSGDQHRIIAIKAKSSGFPGLKGHRLFLQATAAGGTSAIIDTSPSGLISASTYGSPWSDGYRGFQWNLRDSLIHSGDFNGDGDGDLLVQAKPRFVMIDFDPPFPVPVIRPGSFGIVYSPVSSGATAIWNRMQGGVDWSAASSNLLVADFNGDGRDDVLVQSKRDPANAWLSLTNASTSQLNLSSPLVVNLPSAPSGDSYRLIAANINGSVSEQVSGLYLQATLAGTTDLIVASLPPGGGSVSGVAQNGYSQVAGHAERPFTTAIRYNLAGQVTGTISPDPDGSGSLKYLATRNTYDGRGLLTKTESGQLGSWVSDAVAPANWESVTTFTKFAVKELFYDSYGRPSIERVRSGETNALESLVQYSYDSDSRVLCRAVRMNKDVFASPPSDACAQSTQGSFGKDRITRYTYDVLDQVLTETRGYGTSLQQTYVTNEYQANLLRYQTDANGNKTELQYDSFKRLHRRIYPSPTVPGVTNSQDYEEYEYTLTGNLKKERKRDGRTIDYSHDALNRVTRKDLSDPASQDINYRYYPNGVQKYARFGAAVAPGTEHTGPGITNTIDAFGRLLSVRQNTPAATGHSGASRTLSYGYDDNGNRVSVSHPDGQAFSYEFDGLNRVCTLVEGAVPAPCASSSPLLKVEYRADGGRKSLTRTGAVTTYESDPIGRLESISHDFSGSSNDLTNTFSYNPASQITQLIQSNIQYAYAGNFNRTGAYMRNGLNRYTEVAGQPIGYDSNGNLTSDPTLGYSLSYDMENRLVATTGVAAVTSSFKYDPQGRLAQLTIGGVTTDFLYDGDALVAEYRSGAVWRRYVHGVQVDEPWIEYEGAVVSSSTRRHLYADHQGSIVARSDGAGGNVLKRSYDSFGIPSDTNLGRFGYTGQAWIGELGIFHYKARMYSPTLGRFLQTDPIFYADDMNLYAYVGNDPLGKTDPTGLQASGPPPWVADYKDSVIAKAAETYAGVSDTVAQGAKGLGERIKVSGNGEVQIPFVGKASWKGQIDLAGNASAVAGASTVVHGAPMASASLEVTATLYGDPKQDNMVAEKLNIGPISVALGQSKEGDFQVELSYTVISTPNTKNIAPVSVQVQHEATAVDLSDKNKQK